MHPLSQILFSISFFILVFQTNFPYNILLSSSAFSIALLFPRKELDPAKLFLRLIIIGGILLFLMHAIDYTSVSIQISGLMILFKYLSRVIAIMALIVWLSRTTSKESLFTFFTSLHIPIPILFTMFYTFWLIPRFAERSSEIILALRLRGFKSDRLLNKVSFLTGSFSALFNSLFLEVHENSIAIEAKNILNTKCYKPFLKLQWALNDSLLSLITLVILIYPFLR